VLLDEFTAAGEEVELKEKEGLGSTDAGDISHAVPTGHPYIKIGPDDLIGHTVEFREAANSVKATKRWSPAQVLAHWPAFADGRGAVAGNQR
jgi:metal-dependent amidase/aminoacylase/carboxypeptidase family protein